MGKAVATAMKTKEFPILKLLQGLSARFNSISGGKKKKSDPEKETESDEEEDDDSGFDKKEYEKEKVSLNEGKHQIAKAIKRKVIAAGVICLAGILCYAFYFNSAANPVKNNQVAVQNTIRQEPADTKIISRSNPKATEYSNDTVKSLHGKNDNYVQKINNKQSPQNSASAVKGQQNPQMAASVANSQFPSAPFSLPQPASGIQAKFETPEQQAERELNERYHAPISFQISGGTNSLVAAGKPDNSVSGTNNQAASATATASANNYVSSQADYYMPSNNALMPGTVIPVMLYSGINTDTAGNVTAVVQTDVYDTATHSRILIPVGAQLIGKYENSAKNGRVSVSFTSIILPNGGAYSVGECMVATDKSGYAGIAGKVNRHTDRVLSSGMMSSALAALGSVAAGNTSNNSNTYSAGQLAMQGAMANLMNASSKLFEQGANIQQTVTVAPGFEFNVFITQPIIFQ